MANGGPKLPKPSATPKMPKMATPKMPAAPRMPMTRTPNVGRAALRAPRPPRMGGIRP